MRRKRVLVLLSALLLALLSACVPTENTPVVYVDATHDGTQFTLQQVSPAELNSQIEIVPADGVREFATSAPLNDNAYTLRVENSVVKLIYHGVDADEVVFSHETEGEFPRGYRFIVSAEEIGPFAVLLFKVTEPANP